MTKRVLLTGISGSIGVHTFHHIFENTDWEVVGLATYHHKGIAERIVDMMDEHPENWKRLTLITHDLTQPFTKKLKRQIGHIDYIINMASLSDVEASIQNPVPFVQNNVSLTLNVLEFAREVKPQAFIHSLPWAQILHRTNQPQSAAEPPTSPSSETQARTLAVLLTQLDLRPHLQWLCSSGKSNWKALSSIMSLSALSLPLLSQPTCPTTLASRVFSPGTKLMAREIPAAQTLLLHPLNICCVNRNTPQI